MRNLVGMSALALSLAVVARMAMGEAQWLDTSLLAFAVAAPTAWFSWSDSSRTPQGPTGWLLMALGSIAVGGIFLLIDGMFGLGSRP